MCVVDDGVTASVSVTVGVCVVDDGVTASVSVTVGVSC